MKILLREYVFIFVFSFFISLWSQYILAMNGANYNKNMQELLDLVEKEINKRQLVGKCDEWSRVNQDIFMQRELERNKKFFDEVWINSHESEKGAIKILYNFTNEQIKEKFCLNK